MLCCACRNYYRGSVLCISQFREREREAEGVSGNEEKGER